MDDSGWKFCKLYIVRRCISATHFKIMLTDHRRIWGVDGTAEELLNLSRRENPLCEFDVSKVIKNIFNIFDNSIDSLVVDGSDHNVKILKMSSSLGNMPFALVWTLSEKGPDALFEEVTYPLLKCIAVMNKREDYLCHLLVEKDKEIEEHVAENGNVMWGRVKTEKFDTDEFTNNYSFLSCVQDPVQTAWGEPKLLDMYNKTVLNAVENKDDNVGTNSKLHDNVTELNNVTVKPEETLVEAAVETVPDKLPKTVITQVKEEKLDVQPNTSRYKRKKVKLNI